MPVTGPLIAVVDDDESVRESLPDLLRELGYAVEAFASAETFLSSGAGGHAQCLILDIAMPGLTGLELYEALLLRGTVIPTIFITAQEDETIRSRVLDLGAVECLFKPFSETELLDALAIAFRSGRA